VVLVVLVIPLRLGLRRWLGFARRLRRELATPAAQEAKDKDKAKPKAKDKTRIIRSPADEASGALIFMQFISQLTVRLFLTAESRQDRVRKMAERWVARRWALVGVAVLALMASVGFLIGNAKLSGGSSPACLTVAALVGFGLSLLVFFETVVLAVPFLGVDGATMPVRLAVAALVWPVVLALSLILLLFGWEVAVANILLDVSTESAPEGSWTVHLKEPLKEPPVRAAAPAASDEEETASPTVADGHSDVPLMHSVVYENPAVIEDICEWIEAGGGTQNAT
jgi:hypothetical protein